MSGGASDRGERIAASDGEGMPTERDWLEGLRPEVERVVDAARLIKAFDQSGGNDWWEAHAKLYAALEDLDANAWRQARNDDV